MVEVDINKRFSLEDKCFTFTTDNVFRLVIIEEISIEVITNTYGGTQINVKYTTDRGVFFEDDLYTKNEIIDEINNLYGDGD